MVKNILMKKLIILLFFTQFSFSQTAIFNKIKTEGKFSEYITKGNISIKIGDTINIGYHRGENFTFITQGNVNVRSTIANTKAAITKIRTIGNVKKGFKTYLLFGGYGLSVYVDYESALDTGEVKSITFTSNNQKD